MSQQITFEFKEILDIQLQAYKDATSILFTSLNDRIENQNKTIYDLRQSLEFSQEELKEIRTELCNRTHDVNNQKKQINSHQITINDLQQQIARLEDYSRRKNIRINGIEENVNENWEQTHVKVQKMIEEKMNIKTVKVEYAHRLKRNENQRGSRTIIAQLNRAIDRDLILKNSHKLKGSQTYVNEDLSDLTNQKRKEKYQEMKNARSAGKIAYFVKDKLIIKDRQVRSEFTPPRRVSSLVEIFTPRTPTRQENNESGVTPNSSGRNSAEKNSTSTAPKPKRFTRSQLP